MSILNVSVQGDVQAYISEKLAALSAPQLRTDILDEAQALLLNRIRTRFLNTEDTDGNQWEVSEAARRRLISGIGGKTLFDKGNLFHSIQAFQSSGPDERVIGSDVPYGPYHQFGTKKLPKREFLGMSDEDIELIEKIVLLRVKEVFA